LDTLTLLRKYKSFTINVLRSNLYETQDTQIVFSISFLYFKKHF
jgi:hypothetical protein